MLGVLVRLKVGVNQLAQPKEQAMLLMGMVRLVTLLLVTQALLQLGLAMVKPLELVIMEEDQFMLGVLEQQLLEELLVMPKEQAVESARRVQVQAQAQVKQLAKQLVLVEIMLGRKELVYLVQEQGEPMVLEVSLEVVGP